MKTCLKCGESKPTEAFSKRALSLDGLAKWCKTCTNEYNKEYYAKNREKIQDQVKEYRIANKEKKREYDKAYLIKNKEKKYEYHKEWRIKNKDKIQDYKIKNKEHVAKTKRAWRQTNAEKVQNDYKEWRKNNPDKTRTYDAMRRAARMQRTPCWLTEDDKVLIERKYTLAQKKTENTGEKWVVDHILPLRGELVSGLHVPANLRVIKHTTNARKSNKYEPV